MRPSNRKKRKGNLQESFAILFLDFDGVLNTPRTWLQKPLQARIESGLVRRVARICVQANARIVISSSWRCSVPLKQLRNWLALKGLRRSFVVDATRDLCSNRQSEILAWLAEHPECSNYAILDDALQGHPGWRVDTSGDGEWDTLDGRWVRIDPETGITDDDVRVALRILNRGDLQK